MIPMVKAIGLASALSLVGFLGLSWANAADDIAILDVDMKAHLAESLDQSTYQLDDLRLPPDENFTQILLTSFETGRDGHTLIQLRDGDRAATIPYFPVYGNLYVARSIIQELDLRYYNFADVTPDKRPDMPDMSHLVATTPQDDIDPILEIIDILDGFGWEAFKGNCYKNRFPDENAHVVCPETLVFDPKGDMTRRAVIESYIALAQEAYENDDIQILDAVGRPVLGAWIGHDGTLIRAEIHARTDFSVPADTPWPERTFNLELNLNFHSQYAAIRSNRLGDCFPAFEQPRRQYTPTHAQVIFEELYTALGPPELRGDLIADAVRQERIAWGLERLSDDASRSNDYYATRAWDRHFTTPRDPGGAMPGRLKVCDLVPALEAQAGK